MQGTYKHRKVVLFLRSLQFQYLLNNLDKHDYWKLSACRYPFLPWVQTHGMGFLHGTIFCLYSLYYVAWGPFLSQSSFGFGEDASLLVDIFCGLDFWVLTLLLYCSTGRFISHTTCQSYEDAESFLLGIKVSPPPFISLTESFIRLQNGTSVLRQGGGQIRFFPLLNLIDLFHI